MATKTQTTTTPIKLFLTNPPFIINLQYRAIGRTFTGCSVDATAWFSGMTIFYSKIDAKERQGLKRFLQQFSVNTIMPSMVWKRDYAKPVIL
jgi:hypothetical protein